MRKITPADLKDTRYRSGYSHVGYNHTNGQGAPNVKPYQAGTAAGAKNGNKIWRGTRRATALEAAQDYCDAVNSGKFPMPAKLKKAGHVAPARPSFTDPEVKAALGVLRDARAQRRGVPGFVYCIGEKGATKAVKIGYSVSPEKRIAELQTGNPRILVLKGKKSGTEADERNLHRKYAADNILQEWFKATPALLAEFA